MRCIAASDRGSSPPVVSSDCRAILVAKWEADDGGKPEPDVSATGDGPDTKDQGEILGGMSDQVVDQPAESTRP